MSTKDPRYITTTIPYVNASPHMGHALEFVQADALARFWRLLGHEVFFNMGVDEHGQKIARKADEAGMGRQEYVDKYAAEFNKLKEALDLNYDKFTRTTNPAHKAAAQEMWKRCDAQGDIYKKKYRGWYCVGCEAFKTESDLVDGKCPDHLVPPEEVEEENYFFRLSKYEDYLKEYLSRKGVIVPEYRRLEALNFVERGLEDVSISREKARLDWGVPVPDDDSQVMYVWFDALTNYISCLGWPDDADGNFKKFWEASETLQMAGKDQIRFQSILWQAMLKSVGATATDRVFYHGFINSGGHKMSKSLGNVIDPYKLVERYGTDAARYIMLRHVHPTDDSDLTWEKMDEYYTANLVNGLGNLTARILKMSETHLDAAIDPSCVEEGGFDHAGSAPIRDALEHFEFQTALDLVWTDIGAADELIQETLPFKLVKSENAADVERAREIIEQLVRKLAVIAFHLRSALPKTAALIEDAIRTNTKPDNLFPRLEG